MQRSCKTEGAVGVLALEAVGATLSIALVVVEFDEEAMEGAPEGGDVGAAVRVGEIRLEACDLRADAGDLAGAQVDQQVELAVRVEHRGGDGAAVGEVCGEGFDVVREHGEAHGDDIAEVRLQRLNRAEAPEDREDDLPERFHGWEYIPARGAVDSGRVYPPSWGRRWLKSGGMIFGCPTVLHPRYPPISHRLRTCPPPRAGGGPAGGRGVGRGTSRPWVPTFVGRSGAKYLGWWVGWATRLGALSLRPASLPLPRRRSTVCRRRAWGGGSGGGRGGPGRSRCSR